MTDNMPSSLDGLIETIADADLDTLERLIPIFVGSLAAGLLSQTQQFRAFDLLVRRSQQLSTEQGRSPLWKPARWIVDEDDEALRLQIELGHDYAVLLSVSKTGEAPNVTLWRGSGSHSFVGDEHCPGETVDSFREWLAKITDADPTGKS
jgi:hypothetical protein